MNWLVADKLRLRAVEPTDIDHLLRWENHAPYWELSGTTAPFSRNLMERYVQSSQQSVYEAGQQRFMIDVLPEQKTIGNIDLFDFDPFHLRAGVGILIGDEQYRSNGYATQSLQLLINYAFEYLNLQQLYCNILEDNVASVKLFKKLGFTVSGEKKAWIRSGKKFKNELFLQLLREQE